MHSSVDNPTIKIMSDTRFGQDVNIDDFCLIGKLPRIAYEDQIQTTTIGDRCHIGSFSTIYKGAILEADCICEDYSFVGVNSQLHQGVKIQYHGQVHNRVIVGEKSRIGGICCDHAVIGKRCSVYGSLVHYYPNHCGIKDALPPILEDDVIVAFEAVVIGGITIGRGSYIGPGAIVSKNVPPFTLVSGVNRFSRLSDEQRATMQANIDVRPERHPVNAQ